MYASVGIGGTGATVACHYFYYHSRVYIAPSSSGVQYDNSCAARNIHQISSETVEQSITMLRSIRPGWAFAPWSAWEHDERHVSTRIWNWRYLDICFCCCCYCCCYHYHYLSSENTFRGCFEIQLGCSSRPMPGFSPGCLAFSILSNSLD